MKFSAEVRERAVRLVQEHRGDHASRSAALASIAPKIGCSTLWALMLVGWQSTLGLGTDFAVLSIVLAVLVAVAARLYPIILG